jgi:hypothetical protein
MVRRAVKPSLRAASCCSVEVVNGGGGLRRLGRRSTFSTVSQPFACARIACSTLRASASFVTEKRAFGTSTSNFSPAHSVSRAGKRAASFEASASTVQYSRRSNFWISASRSQMRRSATLCTRPRGEAGLDLLPQERRKVEAHQVVEGAPRLVRVDQVVVESAFGLLDRSAHRVPGDLVEAHASQVLAVERALLAQDLREVPGNRLALAVRVGREVEGVRLLHRALDGVDLRLALVDELVLHLEIALGVDRAFLLDEVAHVAVGGEHLEVRAEVLLDGLGLGRRLDDDEV